MEYGTHTHTRTHTQRERGASCTGWAVGGSYWPCDRRRAGWGHLVTGWGMRRFSGKVGWRDHGVSWKGRHGVSGTHWTCTKAIKLHLACRKEHPVGQHPPALGPAYGKILIDPITCVDVWVEGVATAELRVTDATLSTWTDIFYHQKLVHLSASRVCECPSAHVRRVHSTGAANRTVKQIFNCSIFIEKHLQPHNFTDFKKPFHRVLQ